MEEQNMKLLPALANLHAFCPQLQQLCLEYPLMWH